MLFADLFRICLKVGQVYDPLRSPGIEFGLRLRTSMILLEGCVVALVIPLHRRRMRAKGCMTDSSDQKSGNDRAVGVAGNDLGRNDLFGTDDDFLCRAHSL